MKRIILIITFLLYFFPDYLPAQDIEDYNLFLKYNDLYKSGDFLNAEKSMLSVLNSKKNPPEDYIVAAYNNLGIMSTLLGKYGDALGYYNRAEILIGNKQKNQRTIADIYINKAIIYGYQKSYASAFEYFEKGLRIYKNLNIKEKKIFQSLSSAYLNAGIIYYETKNFSTASNYFNLSAELKLKYDLSGLAYVYLNIAKNFGKSNRISEAEKYFLMSLQEFDKEFGSGYYRKPSLLFDYGIFLISMGRNSEALNVNRKALAICLKNYGEKHTITSLAYKHLGDHYLNQNSCDSALYYYQKSLIAVVKDFNDTDVYSNPSIDSAIFDIRLLDNLKSKARALEQFAGKQNNRELKLKVTQKSLETIGLAIDLIDKIRNSYLSEESRIYLAENEKETYIFAVDVARSLYSLTNNRAAVMKMYDIAKKAKSAVLRNEITENDLVYSSALPDSLRIKQNRLSVNISAYNNLILEEMRKTVPDIKKISLWKDDIFEMNRENEKIAGMIEEEFPQFNDILRKTQPLATSEIQKHLGRDETVIDYLLSSQYSDGKRKIYIFLITKESLEFCDYDLDSLFIKNLDIIHQGLTGIRSSSVSGDSFRDLTSSLFYMYENLIRPVESLLSGNRLIIIPDEEIGRLPFDAFLKDKPTPDQTDFEGLHFLVNYYAFSFGYSSSLIFSDKPEPKSEKKVYAFLPDYNKGNLKGNGPENLLGAEKEVGGIYKMFRGKIFSGENATEANFRVAMQDPAIFHLAMHLMSDSSDSRYSYLMFDPGTDSLNDGKLYNYEISTSRIQSPMVVLSACNSGTGKLYHGEGLMSLARGFILAGASSVIRTAWEVNDETSSAIIVRYYFHLSKGFSKDVAMHLAKLDYIKSRPPVFNNPYYWAAYEVLGDNSQVRRKFQNPRTIIITLILIGVATWLIFYFRRRRISSDRLE